MIITTVELSIETTLVPLFILWKSVMVL